MSNNTMQQTSDVNLRNREIQQQRRVVLLPASLYGIFSSVRIDDEQTLMNISHSVEYLAKKIFNNPQEIRVQRIDIEPPRIYITMATQNDAYKYVNAAFEGVTIDSRPYVVRLARFDVNNIDPDELSGPDREQIARSIIAQNQGRRRSPFRGHTNRRYERSHSPRRYDDY